MGKLMYIILCSLLFSGGIFFAYDSFFMHYNNKMHILSPDLVNKNYSEALVIAKDLGLNLEVIAKENTDYPKDFIYLQMPEGYKTIKNTRTIKVAVSLGPYNANLNQFFNLSLPEALKAINNLGLSLKNLSYIYNEMPFNKVIATYPANTKELFQKKQISLLVSAGKRDKIVKMPALVGLSYAEALTILNSMELINIEPRYVDIKGIPKDTVMYQNFPVNKELISGTFVDLVITK